MPHVFDLFAQGDRSSRTRGGLGIGLTLVKSLVEMHGGSVDARSAGVGKGSEFIVRLPLAEVRPLPVQMPELRMALSMPARKVLVTDDNRDAADSLAMLLRLLGAEVRVVYSGRDALEAMKTFYPTVVLLDIGMPEMDGHEVARRIRQQPEFRNVMLIAMTGWGQEEDRRRSQKAGFDYHLIKPADVGALETLLTSVGRQPPPRAFVHAD